MIGVNCAPLQAAQPTTNSPASPRPNIILIVADDLGYGDLGSYGQTRIRTPHLDAMAAEGIRFTQFYAGAPIGAPSRSCLLTGLHTGHVSVRGNQEVLLPPDTVTMANLLLSAGYSTACYGKWGIGQPPPPGDPARLGFTEFFGYLDSIHAHNHYPDFLWKNGTKVPVKGNVVKAIGAGGVAIKKTQYSHDLFVAAAIEFITTHREKPFFLYLPFTLPHANVEAGIEGMEVPDAGPYAEEPWPQPQRNHAAMITRLDDSVGQIRAVLKDLQLDDDTLLLFTSDNGPHAQGGADPGFFKSAGPFRGRKGELAEGGIRAPLLATWSGKIAAGQVTDHLAAGWDFLPTACELGHVKPPTGIDGISFAPTLLGKRETQAEHPFLYWETHEGGSSQAVRFGQWKAILPVGSEIQLYDLNSDSGEQTNVAASRPDVVKQARDLFSSARTPSETFPLKAGQPPAENAQSSIWTLRSGPHIFQISRNGKLKHRIVSDRMHRVRDDCVCIPCSGK